MYVCCYRRDLLHECVLTEAAGCTSDLERSMLTSSQWLYESLDNVGTCAHIDRTCEPQQALQCIYHLGEMLIKHEYYKDTSAICS